MDLSLVEPEREIVEEGNNNAERMTQAIIQNGLDIKYTAEITTHAQRVQHLAANMTKAYSLILGTYCTSTMRSRIKLHPEFQATILDNPIGLLKEIHSCTNAPVRSQYPLIEPVHLLKTFLAASQHANESLEDWTIRFKNNLDKTKLFIGKAAVDHYVEQQDDYKAAAYTPREEDDLEIPLPPHSL